MSGVHDSRLKANEKKLSTDESVICSGTHEHLTNKKKEKEKNEKGVMVEVEVERYTGKIKYPMPAKVFEDTINWTSGNFYYDTGVKTTNGISATVSGGRSIFWKLTSKKLK